ncbi:SoxR reducing system RseC family protein [Pelosinus sp. UFO1]|uniref:SoxR reducing system RseC family protein n=1 Tax=Pelosinus sp. UFO1 TaxID=484770 RepID=UPI0004D133B5|nr:SoxR reducing system RseC family protein [Pelosinus sp. UFO1]AIF53303.1 positive regulator of sigma E, RseC/MucC [Pelosinus sp. UFO1]
MQKQQEGMVLEVSGRMAKVKTSRHNDCENCGACPGNSAMVLDARNSVGAKPGQRVLVEIKEINMLKAAFTVYILPLLAALAGAIIGDFIGRFLGFEELISRLIGGSGMTLLSIWYIKYYDNSARMDDKMQPTIIQIISE